MRASQKYTQKKDRESNLCSQIRYRHKCRTEPKRNIVLLILDRMTTFMSSYTDGSYGIRRWQTAL